MKNRLPELAAVEVTTAPKGLASGKTRVRVECSIGSLNLVALLDSGADYSIIRKEALENLMRLGLAQTLREEGKREFTLVAIDGRPLPPAENVLVDSPVFTLEDGRKVKLPKLQALTMKDVVTDLIIGRDYMEEVGFIINFKDKRIFIENKKLLENEKERVILAAATKITEKLPEENVKEKIFYEIENLKVDHLQKTEQEALRRVLKEHWEVFAANPDAPSETTEVKMTIDTGAAKPVLSKNRPIWGVKEAALKKQVEIWLKAGKIVRSRSPWTSQPLLIPKGDGWRVCIDFRALNAVTKTEDYPTPHIASLLDKLRGSDYFSSLDLANAYLQIPIEESSRSRTAFSTPWGKFEFCCVAFGLKNAPAVFNQYFAEVLSRIEPVPPINFFDDTVIGTEGSFREHLEMLEKTFIVVRNAKLQFKLEKCSFAENKVKFCGFIVDKVGTTPNPEAQEAIRKMAQPENVTEVQSFLGCVNYFRHYMKDFASVAQPMYALTMKGVKFLWNDDCEAAFQELKKRLVEAPALAYPDFSNLNENHFRLATDASNKGIGAVLEQRQEGTFRPINFASRALRAAEKHYSAIELECLALVWGMNKFRDFLEAAPFDVMTDHRPLTYMLHQWRNSNKRIQNWLISVSEFPIRSLVHVDGEKNVVADALSRLVSLNVIAGLTAVRSTMRAAIDQGAAQLLYAMGENDDRSDPIGLEAVIAGMTTRTGRMSLQEQTDREIARALQESERIVVGILDNPPEPSVEECELLLEAMEFEEFPSVELLILRQKDDEQFKELYKAVESNATREELYIKAPLLRRWIKGLGDVVFGLRDDKVLVRVSVMGAVILVPKTLRTKVIACAHSSVFSGHEGIYRTTQRLMRSCWWPGMQRDVEFFIDRCKACKACKTENQSGYDKENARTISHSSTPGAVWHLDFIGPLPRSRKLRMEHVLVAIDEATGYIEVKPTNSPASKYVVSMMMELAFRWGIPSAFRSDNGAAFTATEVRKAAKAIGCKWYEIPPGHPQSNGKVERANRTIKEVVLKKLAGAQTSCDWLDVLIPAVAACNTAPSTSNGGRKCPFELMVGRAPKNLIDLNWKNSKADMEESEVLENVWRGLKETKLHVKAVRIQQNKNKEQKKERKNRIRNYEKGERVLIRHYGPPASNQEKFVTPGVEDPFLSPQSLWRKGIIIGPMKGETQEKAVVYKVRIANGQKGARGMGMATKMEILVHIHHLQPEEKFNGEQELVGRSEKKA